MYCWFHDQQYEAQLNKQINKANIKPARVQSRRINLAFGAYGWPMFFPLLLFLCLQSVLSLSQRSKCIHLCVSLSIDVCTIGHRYHPTQRYQRAPLLQCGCCFSCNSHFSVLLTSERISNRCLRFMR